MRKKENMGLAAFEKRLRNTLAAEEAGEKEAHVQSLLAQFGYANADELMQALLHQLPTKRGAAVYAAAATRWPQAYCLILNLYKKEKSIWARACCLDVLLQACAEKPWLRQKAVRVWKKMLEGDAEARCEAVFALGVVLEKSALSPALKLFAKARNDMELEASAETLARLKGLGSANLLQELEAGEGDRVFFAWKALASFGGDGVKKKLASKNYPTQACEREANLSFMSNTTPFSKRLEIVRKWAVSRKLPVLKTRMEIGQLEDGRPALMLQPLSTRERAAKMLYKAVAVARSVMPAKPSS